MDLNLIRIAITVLALGAFLGIVAWAYAPARRRVLDEQGRRILRDSDS
jgi:cbb3-type cytochrome oxidase subunit 3